MATLQIQITKTDADAMVDSLETAIRIAQHEYNNESEIGEATQFMLADLRRCIESLQMIRVTYMLASRNAAKEAAPKSDHRPRNTHQSAEQIANEQFGPSTF